MAEREGLVPRGGIAARSSFGCPISGRSAPFVELRSHPFALCAQFVGLCPMAERGIRTPEPFGSKVFKTSAFGHSAISPCVVYYKAAEYECKRNKKLSE